MSVKPTKLISRRRLVKEPAPDESALELIDQLEATEDLGGMDLATYAEYLRGLMPGHLHGYDESLPCDRPTKALPGTPEKIKVMRERARRNLSLFHPGDAKLIPRDEKPS